jgi:hypothetical protein
MTVQFSGNWVSRYVYGVDDDGQDLIGEHVVKFEQMGSQVTGTSLPHRSGSNLVLNLEYDAAKRVLTGLWREETSPTGRYRRAVFHGALQFLVDAAGNVAQGSWVGFNSSYSQVKSGEWHLERKQSGQAN